MPKDSQAIIPWQGPPGVLIPAKIKNPDDIVSFATGLRERDKEKIIEAFSSENFEMATEFVWRRTISRLRSSLASLGMKFIGEMLGREDIDEFSSPASALTDYEIVRLAESLGLISPTAALRLRHAFELLSHFTEGTADDELSSPEAISVIRTCVQYVLAEQNIQVAVDFSRIRERLLSETLSKKDPQIVQLLASPPFFLRTALRVLLASIKNDHGAKLEHSLGNMNSLLPDMWKNLSEVARWSIGTAYAEISAAGNQPAILGLKKVLMKVAGFDYVPENLRSNTYKKAARAVITAHFSFGNFVGEIAPVNQLASLGTTIPAPALADCIQAYLCVFLGNFYGESWSAAPVARKELKKLTPERIQYYFGKVIHTDEVILQKFEYDKPAENFISLTHDLDLGNLIETNSGSYKLIHAAQKKSISLVQSEAKRLLRKLGEAVG